MLCQFCKKREATIHFTNVVGNKVQKIHLCRYCAEEKGFDYLKKSNIEKGDLLAGLISLSKESGSGESTEKSCPNCGISYSSLKKGGMLGCSHCYEAYGEQLYPLLRSIHGNTRHVGKIPARFGMKVSVEREIMMLREELCRVIEEENYERAAEIRDKIAELQSAGGKEKK